MSPSSMMPIFRPAHLVVSSLSVSAVLVSLLAAGCAGSGSRPAPMPPADPLFAPYDGPVPGAAVLVLRDGRPVVRRGYGLANLETGTPVGPETRFRLASVTKQFTAAAILLLVEDGRLGLDDALDALFPGFPAYGASVTVRHLLHHVSGLADYEDLIPDTATVQVVDRDVLDMMRAQAGTDFPPGSAYRYSNSGYAVLAMIVEAASGMRFADFLAARLFAPLGMGSVAYERGRSTVAHRAMGYRETDGRWVDADQSITSAVLGDGGIYASIDDLARWDRALAEGALLGPKSWAAAFTPGTLADGEALDYGFGWRIDTYRGHPRVHHTGSTSGFRNVIQRYPEAGLTIVILTNRRAPDVAPLADALADRYLPS